MAKAPTEEQSQLKRRARRRLVGALALAIVVAVVLPWVLEREPRMSDQQIAIQIPAPGAAGNFEPKANASPPPLEAAAPPAPPARPDKTAISPPAVAEPAQVDDALGAEQAKLLAPPAKAGAVKPAAKDKDVREAGKDKPAADMRKKAAERSESPVAEPKPAEPAKAADARPFVVQIAALADADKAVEVQKSLVAKGLKAYTEKVKTTNGEVTRVRVGPFPNRDAAEKERARLKALGFDGNVVPK